MTPIPIDIVAQAISSTAMFAEVLCASSLFAHGQPRRSQAPVRAAAIVVGFLGISVIMICVTFLVASPEDIQRAMEIGRIGAELPAVIAPLAFCAMALVATIPALLSCFEMSFLAATYCATAGYALQNLASSVWELIGLTPVGANRLFTAMPLALTVAYYVLVYAMAWQVFIRRIDPSGLAGHLDPTLLPMIAVVVFGVIGFDLILKYVVLGALRMDAVICLRLIHILVCSFVMAAEVQVVAVHRLAGEKATAERLLTERERQYAMSRENIEAINLKCHDLRHQIRTLADGGTSVDRSALDGVASEIRVYDSAVRTGNEALDTILTEKNLVCERSSITLSCIADGTALAGMAPADIYSFFGNALDNAVRAVTALDDQAHRSISLIVRMRAGMASVHVENYYDPGTHDLEFYDGLPRTTKAITADHGFGTRSMRAIVERYGGTISFSAGDVTFCVDALLPMEKNGAPNSC
jgi:hypothetical protein